MSNSAGPLTVAVVGLSVLTADGSTVVKLANGLPSLVLAVGLVAALLRLVWVFTSRRP